MVCVRLIAGLLGGCAVAVGAPVAVSMAADGFVLPGTGQSACYDDAREIPCPAVGAAFFGQDAQFARHPLSYTVGADGLTVKDNVTGLTWTRSPDLNGDGWIDAADKLSWSAAQAYAEKLNAARYGGYDDWRLPTIKELYSLINFSGVDVSGPEHMVPSNPKPFIDTQVFAFGYGDRNAGERTIDAQYWSTTEYVSTTMWGDHTVFGVNFADGRIKGYGTIDPRTRGQKTHYVRYVRGESGYGVNDFIDNGDGTITDRATGLMWQQGDSGRGLDWQAALAYADALALAGHDDWRLPNVKELQSIVDYKRAPSATGSAAIDPLFKSTAITNEGGARDFAEYWSSTTHLSVHPPTATYAAYVAFGRALGWMRDPRSRDYTLLDVHGAGSQRSDPKRDDGTSYPHGHGPQGDVIRIENLVRAVRVAE